MRRKAALLTLAISMASCGLIAFSSQSHRVHNDLAAMNTTNGIAIANVTLMAREERHLPPGQPPTLDRNVGFADVFMQIQNTTDENATLIIQSIEIRNAFGGRVQLISQSPQTIHLHPLENSALDFHLTNQTGYGRGDRVKAIIRYQIQDQTQVIESDPVTIERL